MTRTLIARFATAAVLAGAALVGTTGSAHAGGCDPFDPSCNQTGGEWCQDIAMVDPATGDIIGYRNICTDLTIDWNEQTPDCPVCASRPADLPVGAERTDLAPRIQARVDRLPR